MTIGISNKVILITEKSRITSPMKIALNKHGLEFLADYPALTSIPVMKAGIMRSGKTAFIRTEFLRFIKNNGFPRAIIMDSQIDSGAGKEQDPGMLKIFKTFMIAYVILSKGSECTNLRGNFILLTTGNAFEKEFGFGTNPHAIMEKLSTQNPEINFFIDELKDNSEKFNELFKIILLDTELSSDIITDTIDEFFVKSALIKSDVNSKSEIHSKNISNNTEIKPDMNEPGETNNDKPARIVFRINEDSVYDDGEVITELSEEHKTLKEKEFYIIGTWSSKTELEVSKKIASVLQKGINENARFGYGDPIIFNIDDRCIIDKNTTLSMAQLFTKNLAVFKKISISASSKNGELIQKSRGFPMIKNIFKTTETEAS